LVLPLLLFRFLLPFLFVAASVLPPSLPPFPSFIEIFLRRSTNLLFKVACAGSCYWYIFVFFSLLLLHKQYFLLYTKVLLPSFLSVRFFQDFFFALIGFDCFWLAAAPLKRKIHESERLFFVAAANRISFCYYLVPNAFLSGLTFISIFFSQPIVWLYRRNSLNRMFP